MFQRFDRAIASCCRTCLRRGDGNKVLIACLGMHLPAERPCMRCHERGAVYSCFDDGGELGCIGGRVRSAQSAHGQGIECFFFYSTRRLMGSLFLAASSVIDFVDAADKPAVPLTPRTKCVLAVSTSAPRASVAPAPTRASQAAEATGCTGAQAWQVNRYAWHRCAPIHRRDRRVTTHC